MKIIKAIATKNPCYKENTNLSPIGILIHSTGANNPNLKRYVDNVKECGENANKNYLNTENAKILVHGFIGYDVNKTVQFAQTLDFNKACWGCGGGAKGSFNYNPHGYIQVEICEDDLTSKEYFEDIWQVAVEFTATQCKSYKWNPLGKSLNGYPRITSHIEANKLGFASQHIDPEHWFKKFGKSMDDFRKDVNIRLTEMNKPVAVKVAKVIKKVVTKNVYTVKGGDALSIIALKNKTTVSKIVALNKKAHPNITPSFIKVGWKLKTK